MRLLRADDRVRCDVLPALSFLDVAWARLGIDPVEAGVRLVDGHEFARAAAGATGPLLIAHTHADWVLSDIKLAVEEADGRRAGGDPAAPRHGRRADHRDDVERARPRGRGRPPHVRVRPAPRRTRSAPATCASTSSPARCASSARGTASRPTQSLVPYLVEETFELVDALEALDPDDPATDERVIEELGDLLYQIEFHATIAEQAGRFSIADVTDGIHDKLVRRHPHVFGDVDAARRRTTVIANWDEIKRDEKGAHVGVRRRRRVAAGARLRPAPARARRPRSASTGPTSTARWPRSPRSSPSCARRSRRRRRGAVADELGDLLFAVVNVARHPGVDAELALRAAAGKFRRRFEAVEALAAERGIDLRAADLATLDALWDEVKAAELDGPADG